MPSRTLLLPSSCSKGELHLSYKNKMFAYPKWSKQFVIRVHFRPLSLFNYRRQTRTDEAKMALSLHVRRPFSGSLAETKESRLKNNT
ncbi:hypothetical protein CEXT_67991 [Caerostris extrusa]|uniref:Uncharacterized protein n=1 Tax=Caerostris extrusa TaxID=172846 RepID=A0AAV4VUB0_CAEEX|nr:hypothetical protein CEXT_67991 [Caerostris extrusa]